VVIEQVEAKLAANPAFSAALRREAEPALGLQHPNLVKVVALIEEQAQLLLVTELTQGQSLSALLDQQITKQAPFPDTIAVALACGILRALDALHNARLGAAYAASLHGQVRPENVQVNLQGTIKLQPACLLRAAESVEQETKRSPARTVYHAPEYWDCQQPLDERSDVYAVSVLLWQLLTATRIAPNALGLVGASNPRALPPMRMLTPDVSTQLEAVVLKGMSPDPEDRFLSAGAMAHALEQVVSIASPATITGWVAERSRNRVERDRDSGRSPPSIPPSHTTPVRRSPSEKPPALQSRRLHAQAAVDVNPPALPTSVSGKGTPRRLWLGLGGALAVVMLVGTFVSIHLLPDGGSDSNHAAASAPKPAPAKAQPAPAKAQPTPSATESQQAATPVEALPLAPISTSTSAQRPSAGPHRSQPVAGATSARSNAAVPKARKVAATPTKRVVRVSKPRAAGADGF
jgi:serine/threonine-protein kinase